MVVLEVSTSRDGNQPSTGSDAPARAGRSPQARIARRTPVGRVRRCRDYREGALRGPPGGEDSF